MNLKLAFAICVLAAVPAFAQAPNQKPPKPTPAAAKALVAQISADKAKSDAYCQLGKLDEEMSKLDPKKPADKKKGDDLQKQAEPLLQKVGADYGAFMGGLEQIDENSADGKAIQAELEKLDKLCAGKK